MICNITHHFSGKRQVRIERNFWTCLNMYQRFSLETHEKMNQTLKNRLMAAFTSKLELQDSFRRMLNSQRVPVANFMAPAEM